jgi:hypothetical protein
VAERDVLRLHIEDPELFRAAVTFTAAETQFTSRLVEKDYFCSVILRHLAAADAGLVFRGGTCLAKVHDGLYRLSEDLDFLIPTPVDASRGERRRRATESRRATTAIDEATSRHRPAGSMLARACGAALVAVVFMPPPSPLEIQAHCAARCAGASSGSPRVLSETLRPILQVKAGIPPPSAPCPLHGGERTYRKGARVTRSARQHHPQTPSAAANRAPISFRSASITS